MFSSNPVLSAMLALSITLALIWLGSRLATIISRTGAHRISGRKTSFSSPMLTIESVIPVAPRRRVIVLRYGEHRLALLTGGAQDISLGWLPAAGAPAAPAWSQPSSSPLP